MPLASLASVACLPDAAAAAPHFASGTSSFVFTVAMWQAMIVAMMVPVVAPWVRAYAAMVAPAGSRAAVSQVSAFVSGYFLVWLAYSVAAAALQLGLQHVDLLSAGEVVRPLGAAVLVSAGVVQFLPLTRRCLSHCRNPLSYLLAHWDNGMPSGLRMGVTHGAYCLGCCWLLMLTGLAMGVMNLAWMALLTGVLVVQQLVPRGEWLGRAFGMLLIGWGLVWGLSL